MKTTKELLFEYIQKQTLIVKDTKCGFTTNDIATVLNVQRSNASALLNDLVKEGKLEKTNSRPVVYSLIVNDKGKEYVKFEKILIGYEGSLSKSLQIAKAAILYPKRNLNVLISAKPGCGTTHFVYGMFQYAMTHNVFKNTAAFIKVNCRNYQSNINELDSILYGSVEYDNLEQSCFNMAKGGMLFIDNADLLNARQFSFVADFLDSGYIFSNDRKSYVDCHDTFLVLSCNPVNANKFVRKIPMVIELPELKNRPLEEHLELINHFFSTEANNSKRNIELPRECMQALLLTDFVHNIKDLEMEIKKACATACVRVVDDLSSNIKVSLYDFSQLVANSLIKLRTRGSEIEAILGNKNIYIYDSDKGCMIEDFDFSSDLYEEMQSQYNELAKRGINAASIQDVINNHVENLFKKYKYYSTFEENYDIEQLSKIVNPQVITLVQNLLQICKEEMNRKIKPSVFYGLCLHVNSLLTINTINTRRIDNEQVVKIIKEYPKEYAASIQFAQSFKENFNTELPLEEVVIITMFLIKDSEEDENGHPVLLYIMHGNGVASSLCDVTNNLTKCNNVYGYDLTLDQDTKQALEEIKLLIQNIDNGHGVFVIYDMGSIKTMIETIAQQTNIKIRSIFMPITLVGIDVSRKCMLEEDIDYVYHSTQIDIQKMNAVKNNLKEVIITLCHTGEGGAYQLKQYIDQYSKLDMKTIALSISNREKLIQQVMEIKKIYQIHSFVGSYDPKLLGIPFIPMAKIFENASYDLDRVLMFEPVISKPIDMSGIYNFLEEQMLYVSIPKVKSTIPGIIDELALIYNLDGDKKIGLFVHLVCMLERLLSGEKTKQIINAREIITIYKDDFNAICRIIKPLEKKFRVIIDDNQIVMIMMVVNEKIK